MNFMKYILLGASLVLLSGTSAAAQYDEFINAPEKEWIALSGTVASLNDDSFTINHPLEDITIEMDGFAWYDENVLRLGDFVIIRGHVDIDFFEGRTLQANSVYVRRLSEYIYADESDENSFYANSIADYAEDGEWISLSGTVLDVDVEGQEFVLDAGFEAVVIDTSGLETMPILMTGGRVSVYGQMDDADLWEGREILAASVTKMSRL